MDYTIKVSPYMSHIAITHIVYPTLYIRNDLVPAFIFCLCKRTRSVEFPNIDYIDSNSCIFNDGLTNMRIDNIDKLVALLQNIWKEV